MCGNPQLTTSLAMQGVYGWYTNSLYLYLPIPPVPCSLSRSLLLSRSFSSHPVHQHDWRIAKIHLILILILILIAKKGWWSAACTSCTRRLASPRLAPRGQAVPSYAAQSTFLDAPWAGRSCRTKGRCPEWRRTLVQGPNQSPFLSRGPDCLGHVAVCVCGKRWGPTPALLPTVVHAQCPRPSERPSELGGLA